MAGGRDRCRAPDRAAAGGFMGAVAVRPAAPAHRGRPGGTGPDRLAPAAGRTRLATRRIPGDRLRRGAGRRLRRAHRPGRRRAGRRRAGRRRGRPLPRPARHRRPPAGPHVPPGRRPRRRARRCTVRSRCRRRRDGHAVAGRRARGGVREARPPQRRRARRPRARRPAHCGQRGDRGARPRTRTGHRSRRGERPVHGRPDHPARRADPVHRRPQRPGGGANPVVWDRPERGRPEGAAPRERGRRPGIPRGQRRPRRADLGRCRQQLRASHPAAADLARAGGDAGAPDRPRRGPGGRRLEGGVGRGRPGRRQPGDRSSRYWRLCTGVVVSAPRDTMQACRPIPWNPPPASAW
jgi:hypothetical protein